YGGGVILERIVPVQVVRRDVQTDADVGAKGANGFELEAGQLEHIPLIGTGSRDDRRHSRADVAADLRGDAGLPQDVSDQRRGSRLAIRSGDSDDLPLQISACELDF